MSESINPNKEKDLKKKIVYIDMDGVLVDLEKKQTVSKDNILYQCGWSPFEGHTFASSISKTFVSGNMVYSDGVFIETDLGMRLEFDR